MKKILWSFLGITFARIGYVEELDIFGFKVYRRCGVIVNVLGIEWRVGND